MRVPTWVLNRLLRLLPHRVCRWFGLPGYYHEGGPAPFRGPYGPHW